MQKVQVYTNLSIKKMIQALASKRHGYSCDVFSSTAVHRALRWSQGLGSGVPDVIQVLVLPMGRAGDRHFGALNGFGGLTPQTSKL